MTKEKFPITKKAEKGHEVSEEEFERIVEIFSRSVKTEAMLNGDYKEILEFLHRHHMPRTEEYLNKVMNQAS